MKIKANWDNLGIITSVACAIHCAVLPLLLTSLPFFGINIIHNVFFEWSMIAIAFGVGIYALYHGYITHHRSLKPIMLFSGGMVFLIAKQIYVQHEILLLIPAVIMIISAHYYNFRLCQKNKCSSPHHVH